MLSFADESFDFCLVHSGLHHCRSPHRGPLEVYRVTRAGLLLFEPYDSATTRLGVRLHIGQEYEHAGVFRNWCRLGGVSNTAMPNYVYRFTEREIIKTISSYAPYARHEFSVPPPDGVPWIQLRTRRNQALYRAVRLAQPALKLLETCAPKQTNIFAAWC